MKKMFGAALGLLLTAAVCGAGTVTAWADVTDGTAAAGETTAAEETAAPEKPEIQVSAQINSCTVTSDKQNIHITGSSSGDPVGTDGNIYMFELQPYESGIGDRRDYLWKTSVGQAIDFTLPANWSKNSPDRLYDSYVAAVYDGEKFVEVSAPHYVTNPEVVAANQKPFNAALTKKGLRIQIDMLDDAMDLGVKHAGTDIMFQQILGEGITYEYDGKTYHFSAPVMADYDRTIGALSNKGISVTAVILNGWSDNTPDLVYPGVKKTSSAYHYMFNVATPAGYEQTRAIAAFLAERYDGSNPNYGKVSNWVIGNEVNNQKDWNYMGPMDLTNYVRTYLKAFRVFYTAIKTASASDRVYISLDYNWNNEIDGKLKYGGKNIVDSFNSIANVEGQFDWGLAYHPYPYPMTEPEFWDDDQSGLVTNDFNSPIINFKNLNTLTDYFAQETLRTPAGHVRHIILTEQGFTAKSLTRGDVPYIQAAAFAYSYYLVDSNPYIDAYLLSRQVDGPAEVVLGTAQGLWECDLNQPNRIVATKRRKIWEVFKNIDKKNSTPESTEFAKSIIGIDKWSDVVPNFKWRSLEN